MSEIELTDPYSGNTTSRPDREPDFVNNKACSSSTFLFFVDEGILVWDNQFVQICIKHNKLYWKEYLRNANEYMDVMVDSFNESFQDWLISDILLGGNNE